MNLEAWLVSSYERENLRKHEALSRLKGPALFLKIYLTEFCWGSISALCFMRYLQWQIVVQYRWLFCETEASPQQNKAKTTTCFQLTAATWTPGGVPLLNIIISQGSWSLAPAYYVASFSFGKSISYKTKWCVSYRICDWTAVYILSQFLSSHWYILLKPLIF